MFWNVRAFAATKVLLPAGLLATALIAPTLLTEKGSADAASAAPAAPKEFQDCSGCPVMVVIPTGSYTMGTPQTEKGRRFDGDEGPQHTVTINYSLAVGKFEITRDEYARFADETNRGNTETCSVIDAKDVWTVQKGFNWRNPGFPQTGRHPVVCVLYQDAKDYVQWLSAKTGKNYRLLSEAEWEYAARAGSAGPGPWGDDPNLSCPYGNGADQTGHERIAHWVSVPNCRDGYVFTAPVGSFKANAFGLYDMHGNVWEWNEDCYFGSYNGAPTDGSAWHQGDCDSRVKRGGSFRCVLMCNPGAGGELAANSMPGATIRSGNRDNDGPADRSSNGGFRIARLAD